MKYLLFVQVLQIQKQFSKNVSFRISPFSSLPLKYHVLLSDDIVPWPHQNKLCLVFTILLQYCCIGENKWLCALCSEEYVMDSRFELLCWVGFFSESGKCDIQSTAWLFTCLFCEEWSNSHSLFGFLKSKPVFDFFLDARYFFCHVMTNQCQWKELQFYFYYLSIDN